MKLYIQQLITGLGVSLCLFAPLQAAAPHNLYHCKENVELYHDSGKYDADIAQVAEQAMQYLRGRIEQNKQADSPDKLALVLDIDETSLSNYAYLHGIGFGYSWATFAENAQHADDVVISPVHALYELAKENGVSVFFITGRLEKLRDVTVKNLKGKGYEGWQALYMANNSYHEPSISTFKSHVRQKITEQGYTIVLNVGDQVSDFEGGFAEKSMKLPNPYYIVP